MLCELLKFMCQINNPCGGIFTQEIRTETHTIYRCLNSHHFIEGIIPELPFTCEHCGGGFGESKAGTRFCSVECSIKKLRLATKSLCGHKPQYRLGLCRTCHYKKYEASKQRERRKLQRRNGLKNGLIRL